MPMNDNKRGYSSSTANTATTNDKRMSGALSVLDNEKAKLQDQEDQQIKGLGMNLEDLMNMRPDFIKEENIKDLQGRRPDDPQYDPTTLLIPGTAWKDFTPAMYQYWELKQTNNDKILFFKLGKFYEMFFNDAIIC